jgi:type I restriction enzyme S subunit
MSGVNEKIPYGWEETTLGEIANTNPESIGSNYPYDEILYLDTGSITKGKIESLQVFNLKEAPSRAKRLVQDKDIVYSTVRPNQEHYGFISEPNKNIVVSTGFAVIRAHSVDEKLLYYYLTQSRVTNYLHTLAVHSTSAYPSIKPIDIESLSFAIPEDLAEQKAIANILTAFDDKIENLQAQNATLEQTAQTIFKEWFGKYQVGDELQSNWSIRKLGKLSKLKSGYAFKSKDFVEKSSFKALKIKDLKGNGNVSVSDVSSIDENCTKIERVQYFRLKEGDIVLAMSGNTTGKIGVIPPHSNEIYLNQRVGKFFLKDENQKSFLYNFLMSGNFEEKILSMGYGSAQPNISPSQIENIDIFFQDDDKQKEYLKISNPIYDKVLMNNSQIQSLKKTRDTLLPKLMSGQLRINDYKV